MPFVGETGSAVRGGHAGRRMTATRSAMGGERACRTRTPSRATTCCSRFGSTSTSRASSTATSARPISRPRSTWSSSARRRGSPTTRGAARARSRAEAGWTIDRRTGSTASWSRSRRRRARCGRVAAVPRPRQRCFDLRPVITLGRRSSGAGDRARCPRARFRAARRPARRTRRALDDPGRPPAGGRRRAGRPIPRRVPRPQFGLPEGEELKRRARPQPALERLQLVRGRAGLARRPQHGPADAGAGHPSRARPRDVPGHHLEHAWKEADLLVEEGRLEASMLLINTPECLISEGPGGRRARGSRRRRRSGPSPSLRSCSRPPGSRRPGGSRGRGRGRCRPPREGSAPSP